MIFPIYLSKIDKMCLQQLKEKVKDLSFIYSELLKVQGNLYLYYQIIIFIRVYKVKDTSSISWIRLKIR